MTTIGGEHASAPIRSGAGIRAGLRTGFSAGFAGVRTVASNRTDSLVWPGFCTPPGMWAHHFYGHPIVFFAPRSSAGCAITDTLIALWFFAGAPRLYDFVRRGATRPGEGTARLRTHLVRR